ncbi:hypothetical protein O181_057654 [Austropuccinia psidii MF-1]|uniref:Endonuclease III homolog n=1 Tax=Austropuccinia psidii MF-1 TaxID=1389203 RepID=A0A9Q3EAY6_9BASI|nr:hypothetical protein [Austropuccinia psidii MF-1]
MLGRILRCLRLSLFPKQMSQSTPLVVLLVPLASFILPSGCTTSLQLQRSSQASIRIDTDRAGGIMSSSVYYLGVRIRSDLVKARVRARINSSSVSIVFSSKDLGRMNEVVTAFKQLGYRFGLLFPGYLNEAIIFNISMPPSLANHHQSDRPTAQLRVTRSGRPDKIDRQVTLFSLSEPSAEKSASRGIQSRHFEKISSQAQSKRIQASPSNLSPKKKPKHGSNISLNLKLEDSSSITFKTSDSPPQLIHQNSSPSKTKSPRKPKTVKVALESPSQPPARWEEAYRLIRQQRQTFVAPVDTMGCDQAGQTDLQDLKREIPAQSDKERRLTTLVSLMLSSQTKDEVTAQATLNLRLHLKNGLSVDSLRKSSLEDIQSCINKVGFWRRKAEYLKEMAETLHSKYDSDVPKTLDELVSIKGVGPKMAFLALACIWSINAGIGVDTHVHRITNRLGWLKTTAPEQTRVHLESWLPKDLFQEINHLLVGFGQVICLPVGPKCDQCSLGESPGLCPSRRIILKKQKSKSPQKFKRAIQNIKDEKLIFEDESKQVIEKQVTEKAQEEELTKVKTKGEELCSSPLTELEDSDSFTSPKLLESNLLDLSW